MSHYDSDIPLDRLYDYVRWLRSQSASVGRPVNLDKKDYDIQGLFLDGGSFTNGHARDRFKKPNHPTFSEDSKYHETPDLDANKNMTDSPKPLNLGGRWVDGGFVPGSSNLQHHTPMQLYNYFDQVEPGVRLLSPENENLSLLSYLLTRGY